MKLRFFIVQLILLGCTFLWPLWLEITPATGMLPPDSSGTIQLDFNASGLESGDYSCLLEIIPSAGSPLLFPVTLRVISAPQAPAQLTISLSGDAIQLTWQEVSGAMGYIIYRSTHPEGDFIEIGFTTETQYFDPDPAPGQKYFYRITTFYGN